MNDAVPARYPEVLTSAMSSCADAFKKLLELDNGTI